jgi:hemerythrin-like domain-containing protein
MPEKVKKRRPLHSLRVLMRLHAPLRRTFFESRRAALHGAFAESLSHLEAFERLLFAHMRDEEECILPLFKARGGERPGARAELFEKEHAQMRRLLRGLKRRSRALAARGKGGSDAAALILLDRQAQFQSLMQHHDEREKNMLYPVLDSLTSPEERRDIRCRLRWANPSRFPS